MSQTWGEDGRQGTYQLQRKQTVERGQRARAPPASLPDVVLVSHHGHCVRLGAPVPRPRLLLRLQKHHFVPSPLQALGWRWLPAAVGPRGGSTSLVSSFTPLTPLLTGPSSSKCQLRTLMKSHCTNPVSKLLRILVKKMLGTTRL